MRDRSPAGGTCVDTMAITGGPPSWLALAVFAVIAVIAVVVASSASPRAAGAELPA